jgi:hypothetical protein
VTILGEKHMAPRRLSKVLCGIRPIGADRGVALDRDREKARPLRLAATVGSRCAIRRGRAVPGGSSNWEYFGAKGELFQKESTLVRLRPDGSS